MELVEGQTLTELMTEQQIDLKTFFEIAIALTSQPQRAGFPLTLELNKTKLPKRSWVKISQIRTLSVDRIGRKLASAKPEELSQIVEGLLEIVGD